MKKILIDYYKNFINPLLPDMCIYTPSCSAYMGQAIEKYGLIKGLFLGIARIFRCNPWAKGGSDPVKDNFKGNAKWLL
ncbi:MAG: membrane protein insertion efficiency factor YidD [Christensenella sp.]|nr:membrane protein insertion efficiency factor YidD [Christensenella sp.]